MRYVLGGMFMSRKKLKKYEQTISTPYFEPTQGSQLLQSLAAILNRLFDGKTSSEPSRQEIIDYHLTSREREIAYLAALGFSDKEIADALVMNFQTVRVHLRNILNKLRLNDVRELRNYFAPNKWP